MPGSERPPLRPLHALALAGLTLACLLPFLDKPLHIDDPVYVRVARHILESPADFYGLEMNWHGQPEPVAAFNKNPPGVSFYLALAGATLGWSERALHGAMLLPALALVLATGALGRRLAASPRAASLSLLAMPAFLVSATTLMADVAMLALWCWALVLWLDGLERRSGARLLGAALLASLCALTKYNGLALLPLLALCALLRPRDGWRALAWLLLPVAVMAAFDGYMRARYGASALGDVGAYALSYRPADTGPGERLLVGLSFLGGGLLVGGFMAPLLWSRRVLAAGLGLGTAGLLAATRLDDPGPLGFAGEAGLHWTLMAQLVLFALTGVGWLALAVADAVRRRDAASWLLAAWLGGVFVFATLVNWSVNARALLPAAPAAALLLARRMDLRHGAGAPEARPWLLAPLAPALLLALAVAWADARLAESARRAPQRLLERHAAGGQPAWFRGAWGFQHYAERAGARKIDERDSLLPPGSVVLLPTNNSGSFPLAPEAVTLLERAELPAAGWLATMAPSLGAGFYSDLWGPLPFALGAAPAEHYYVLRVDRPVRVRTHRELPSGPPLR